MKKAFLALLLLISCGSAFAEINFACYVDGTEARCFPTENSMLEITFGMIDYADKFNQPYTIRTDRRNKMVFIFFGNIDTKTIKNMRDQGIALQGIEAMLQK